MTASWSAYAFLVSIFSSALLRKSSCPPCTHTPPPSTEQKISTWAGCAGLSSLLLLYNCWRWEASGIRLSPDYFFSFSFNATELRSIPLLMLLHCSRWLLHQKRKESFDLDMPFFSVPLYNFCRKTKTWLSASLVSVLSGKNSCFYQMSSQNL